MAEQSEKFEGWCILELMGHRRLGGLVREVELAGAGFLRIDIPGAEGEPEIAATQFYSPAAVYGLTPTTEAMARAVASYNKPAPVQRWELPPPPTTRASLHDGPGPFGEDEPEDDDESEEFPL